MARVKQLTVALENRPGTLAHMAKVLADAKVNVLVLLASFSLENMWETHETCAPRWNVPAPLRSARREMGRFRGEIERAATLVML